MGGKNMTGSSVINGLARLVKKKLYFDDRKLNV